MSNGQGLCCQFTTLTTTAPDGDRVDGYTQSFDSGTLVGAAKAAVLGLMPKDTKTTSYFIQHDSNGATCVFWNIQSTTLGTWFSGKKVGDAQGVMGIELNTLDASGNIGYRASDVTEAVVSLSPESHATDC